MFDCSPNKRSFRVLAVLLEDQAKICARELACVDSRCLPWSPVDDETDDICSSKVSNTTLRSNF